MCSWGVFFGRIFFAFGVNRHTKRCRRRRRRDTPHRIARDLIDFVRRHTNRMRSDRLRRRRAIPNRTRSDRLRCGLRKGTRRSSCHRCRRRGTHRIISYDRERFRDRVTTKKFSKKVSKKHLKSAPSAQANPPACSSCCCSPTQLFSTR